MTDILLPIAWLFPYGRYIVYGTITVISLLIALGMFSEAYGHYNKDVVILDIVCGLFFTLFGLLVLVNGFELVRFRIV